MNIEIDDNILLKLKGDMPWLAFETSDSKLIEAIITDKLYKNVCDGFELDPFSKAHSLYSFLKEIDSLIQFNNEFTIFNIKGMKTYNDVNGFPAGDELLKMVSKFLIESVSPEKLYRISGDRFFVKSLQTIDRNEIPVKIEIIRMKNISPAKEIDWLFHHKETILDLILNASITNKNEYFKVTMRATV